uniref:Fe2OG dioxygenase domain-containing protein n=1 Tax=Araucaria cunninghamii TaxID=56994 RepID=A0A0D6QYA7_ARACU
MSSMDVQQQHGARAPPPTPSQGNHASAVVNNDAFSAFLERSLGIATLVLPESPTATASEDRDIPLIDLCGERKELVKRIAESASEFGCFQVVNHGVPAETADIAEQECNRLFELPLEIKEGICRSLGSPFGFDDGACDTSTSMRQESFWLQKSAEQIEELIKIIWPEGCVKFSRAVEEYSRALEKVSKELLDLLLEGLGKWPERSDFTEQVASNNASVVCITNQKGAPKSQSVRLSHSHPYILSLQYQSTSYGYQVYGDRTWVRVFPQPGSLLVTLGDILKVWSNGKYKNVIGRPVGEGEEETHTWMGLIYSPSMESTISPIAELFDSDEKKNKIQYASFSLKDYASRIRKQTFIFKDPLDRYRIK